MTKVLVINAHPNMEQSKYNKYIINEIKNNTSVTIHKLEHNFDVAKEQELLLNHDTIVYQFPLFWYSFPALLKDYFDKVFAFGFAYGPNGEKLKNKNIMLSITTGGPQDAYTPAGYNKLHFEDILKPMNLVFGLPQCNVLETFVIHGCNPNPQTSISHEIFQGHVKELVAKIKSL